MWNADQLTAGPSETPPDLTDDASVMSALTVSSGATTYGGAPEILGGLGPPIDKGQHEKILRRARSLPVHEPDKELARRSSLPVLEYHRDVGKTVVTIPCELEVWAHRKQVLSARFWHAVVEACKVLVVPSHKTLDDTQKARVKERMQENENQSKAPEKELSLPLFEYAGNGSAAGAFVVSHAYPGLHAGTHILPLFKSLMHLRSSEDFDVCLIRFHRSTRVQPGESGRNFGFRLRGEAQLTQSAHFAYELNPEDLSYEVNELGALKMLTEPFISRRI